VEDAGRRLLLDDLVAGPEPVAPQTVLHVDPVNLDRIPVHRGRRRIEDVEAAVTQNLRSAEEARRALETERRRLVAEADIRRRLDRELATLRREIERMREGEGLRAAQARYTAEREARKEVNAEVEQVVEEQRRALAEVDRLRNALDSDRALMLELSERVREEQAAKLKAQADADSAMDARRQAEARLESFTAAERQRADEELKRLNATEAALREALAERDDLANCIVMQAEHDRGPDLRQTVEDLEHLVAELEANLTSERARTDLAEAKTAELTTKLESARLQADEALRERVRIEQLEAELEGALVAHGAAVERARVLEERQKVDADRDAKHASEMTQLRRQLDSATEELESMQTAQLDAADAGAADTEKVRDLERLLDITQAEHDSLMQEVSDLRDELASRPASAEPDPAAEARERELADRLAGVESDLLDARATRDAFAHQVKELEAHVASASTSREELLHTIEELERALSQEQSRVREAEEELRRLPTPASDAHAQATGRAEPEPPAGKASNSATGKAPESPAGRAPEPPAQPEPAAEAEPEPDPESASEPAPRVERRSAMAELAGIASFDTGDGFYRR
jgi:chromosome segregation ATPase